MHKRTPDEICRIWIYAGVFTGWWCYDDVQNMKINRIYKDYCIRNNINDEKIFGTTDLSSVVPKILSKKNLYVSDPVNFDNNIIICTNNENKYDIDYIISMSDDDYRIDFENMKQINISDPKKQKSIKQICIPYEIYIDQIAFVKYLKNYDVKGICGKKFD